jgi:hypothetical protein
MGGPIWIIDRNLVKILHRRADSLSRLGRVARWFEVDRPGAVRTVGTSQRRLSPGLRVPQVAG